MIPPSTLLVGIELDEFLGHHLARYYGICQNALQPGRVLRFEQELRAGEDKHELAEGDAIYFDSTVPHGYRRVGAKRTRALVVALGPRE